MNDLERQLRSLAFREPPADLRRSVIAAAETTPRRTWRDWFWPSPYAWGAIAALWVFIAALDSSEPGGSTTVPAQAEFASLLPHCHLLLLRENLP
jgi:hypothetical protein